MKFREGLIPKTRRELRDAIIDLLMRAPTRRFPESYDLEGAYLMLQRGVENLRQSFGDSKADQLLDMIQQAKLHHQWNDKLGSRLLQDAEMVVADRQPYAYPKERYRWKVDHSLPDSTEADFPSDDADVER